MLKNKNALSAFAAGWSILALFACAEDAQRETRVDAAVSDGQARGDLLRIVDQPGGGGEGTVPLDGTPGPAARCAPLPAADPLQGKVTRLDPTQVGSLRGIIAAAEPGETFLLADGDYQMKGEYLWISAAGVTLRSESGDRGAVTLNGNYQSTEIITVAASDVTVADLTIREAYTHAIHVVATAEDSAQRARIYNVHIIDSREQAIKINVNAPERYPDQGEVACSSWSSPQRGVLM